MDISVLVESSFGGSQLPEHMKQLAECQVLQQIYVGGTSYRYWLMLTVVNSDECELRPSTDSDQTGSQTETEQLSHREDGGTGSLVPRWFGS